MMRNIRVLGFGGRNFGNPCRGTNPQWEQQRDFVFATMDHLHDRKCVQSVIVGRAPGADTCVEEWAKARGIIVLPFEAEWQKLDAPGAKLATGRRGPYNVNAGFDRNRRMLVEGKPQCAVQFPGGSGTRHMRRLLDEAAIPVWERLWSH